MDRAESGVRRLANGQIERDLAEEWNAAHPGLVARANIFDFQTAKIVIARSDATKQSIYPRVVTWIASLRSQ